MQTEALWLSRPPFLLLARITEPPSPSGPPDRFRYEVLDRDGSVLLERSDGRLDEEWRRCYQPITPGYG